MAGRRYLFDAAAYPVFAAEYFGERLDLSDTDRDLVGDLFVVVITVIKLCGTEYLVKASGFLFAVSMIPATIYMVYGAKDLNSQKWMDTNTTVSGNGASVEGMDEAMLLSWIVWLYSGFASLGALAGETVNPKRSYPIVIAVLVPLVRRTLSKHNTVQLVTKTGAALRSRSTFCSL